MLAWLIPKRIMWEQTYSGLVAEYRSYDFAAAVQGIVEFFTVECAGNVDKVGKKYKERFFRDMYDVKDGAELSSWDYEDMASIEKLRGWYKDKSGNRLLAQKEPCLCLHYQRRLLTQFFYQLDLCTCYSRSYRRRIQRDFTKNKAQIIRILLAINESLEADPILFKSLECDYRVRPEKSAKGINHWLSHLYHILDKSKPRMQY